MSFMGVSMDNILLYHKLNSNLQKINLQHINENKEQMQNEDIDTNSLQLKTLNRVNTTRSVEQKKIKNSKGNPSIRIMETKLKTMNYASQKKNIQQIIEEIKKLEQVSQSKKKLQIKEIEKYMSNCDKCKKKRQLKKIKFPKQIRTHNNSVFSKSNVSKSNVSKSNVSKSNVSKLFASKSNVSKLFASKLFASKSNVSKLNVKWKNAKNIKLPSSKYVYEDGTEIISLNNGNYLILGNMCFVYRNTVNNYYNSKLSLKVLSINNNNYTLYTSNNDYIEIRHTSDILNIYESLMLLKKCKMLNHPVRLKFHDELFSNDLIILCNFKDDNLMLDFSDSVSYTCWNEMYSQLSDNFELIDYKIYIPIEKLEIDQWEISIQDNLIKLKFDVDNKILLSGSIFNDMKIEGISDMSLRSYK
jgi:hypothetical protein